MVVVGFSRQTALSRRGSPHLFFFRLKVKQPPKITCVLRRSNVSESESHSVRENSCQLIKSPTRARTRFCLGQQTENELAYLQPHVFRFRLLYLKSIRYPPRLLILHSTVSLQTYVGNWRHIP